MGDTRFLRKIKALVTRVLWQALGALCVCLFAICPPARGADGPLKLAGTIPLREVDGRIDHLSLTADGQLLAVAALGNNSVEIVDTAKGAVVAHVGGFAEPQGVCFIPDSGRLAVASGGDGNVRIYDAKLKLLGTISDLDDADNVRYDADARLLYVGYGTGALAVIDPEKIVKVADIRLDGHPESFQLESSGERIFVNVPRAGEIEVIDREKRSVIAKWALSAAPANYPMALDEEHQRLFVGCRKPAKMLVFDTASGKIVTSIDCVADTDDVFCDAAHQRIYISGGGGEITVLQQKDPDHYGIIQQLKTAAGARTSLFAPRERLLYLAVPHRGDQRARIQVYQSG